MKQTLLLFIFALSFIAASADESGTCGANLTWSYVEATKTLTISGTGTMADYDYNTTPWFPFRAKIANLYIGNGVKSVGRYAFYDCTGLISVTIPNSVTSISDDAFSKCNALSFVEITDLTAWCKINFLSYYSNPLYFSHHLYLNGEEIIDLVIPNGIETIGQNAFCGGSSFTSVTIPNTVTSIGINAFLDCSGVTSVTIPNSVTSIENYAFSGCSRLTKVTIPNSVTSIDDGIFSGCRGLINVIIPNSVISIGYKAFNCCTSLPSVTIPNSVTYIESSAFWGCTGLTSITIPSSVTSIGSSAFCNCYRLHTIYCLNPIPPECAGTNTFICSSSYDVRDKYDVYTYATLHVPMGSGELYGSAYEWRYFNKIKEDMEADGRVYYANLTVQQGTTGFTRQAIKASEKYTIYIGSLGQNRVNAVTFNGVDVTDQVANGYYTTPEIKGESVLSVSYETTTSARALTLENVKVTGYNGEITIQHIDEPSDVSVYSVDGKLIESIPEAFGSANVQVPAEQLYIVKVGSRTYKVAL